MTAIATPATPEGTIVEFESREDWLEGRAQWVGASEVAALFGASNWDSLFSLWATKSGVIRKDAQDAPSRHMMRGRRFEPLIAEEVREELGWTVHEWPQTACLVHDDSEFRLGCTPDCIVDDGDGPAIADFKLCSELSKRAWVDEPPANYQMQLQSQMAVSGIHRGYLLVVFGMGAEVLPIPVDYHDGFQAELRKRVVEFWDSVQRGEQPEVDGSESTFKALKGMYPTDDESVVPLIGTDEEDAIEFDRLKTLIKSLEGERDTVKAKLIAAIGDASYGVCPGGLGFSHKKQSARRLDKKAIREFHPEIVEDFTKESEFRVLRKTKNIPKDN